MTGRVEIDTAAGGPAVAGRQLNEPLAEAATGRSADSPLPVLHAGSRSDPVNSGIGSRRE